MARSRIFQRALTSPTRRRAEADLDRDIERYYSALTVDERREDSMWASLGYDTARSQWDP